MPNTNTQRAQILTTEIDALFKQPSKRTLRHAEAVNVLAKLDGRRNDNVEANANQPKADVAMTPPTPADAAEIEQVGIALSVSLSDVIGRYKASLDKDDNDHSEEGGPRRSIATETMSMLSSMLADHPGIQEVTIEWTGYHGHFGDSTLTANIRSAGPEGTETRFAIHAEGPQEYKRHAPSSLMRDMASNAAWHVDAVSGWHTNECGATRYGIAMATYWNAIKTPIRFRQGESSDGNHFREGITIERNPTPDCDKANMAWLMAR